jgi:xanthosine utilization system XapX-like protein
VFTATKLPAPVPPLIGLIGAAGVLLVAIAMKRSPNSCSNNIEEDVFDRNN